MSAFEEGRDLSLVVGTDDAGQRLDVWLADQAGLVSRSAAQRLISQGLVSVNGAPAVKHHAVHAGETVDVTIPPAEPDDVQPEEIPLDIRYEDEDLIVLSKPAGLVVHPAHGHRTGTMVNALLAHTDDLAGVGGVQRPGIVHRLDKDTSGLMLVAKNDQAHQVLSGQLSDRTLTREYLALVHGEPPSDEGIVDAPIGRSARDRKKMAVVNGGREAKTHFKVERRADRFTLLRLSLSTGRTHQIRVHLAYLEHPVVGDPVYGRKSDAKMHGLDRQFLHAAKLSFVHPTSSKRMTFEDELPEDLASFLESVSQ